MLHSHAVPGLANNTQSTVESSTTSQYERGSQSTKCNLLELAAELRLIIYHELVAAMVLDWAHMRTLKTLSSPALLSTCKTLRAEAGEVYFDWLYEEAAKHKTLCGEAHAKKEVNEEDMGRPTGPDEVSAWLKGLVLESVCSVLDKDQVLVEALIGKALDGWMAEGHEYTKK